MIAFLKSFFKSLRFRLFLYLMIFAVAPGIVLRAGVISACQSYATDTRINEVVTQVRLFSTQINRTDYLTTSSLESVVDRMEQMAAIYDARLQVVNESGRIIYDSFHRAGGRYSLSPEVLQVLKEKETVRKVRFSEDDIRVAIPIFAISDPVAKENNAEADVPDQMKVRGVLYVCMTADFARGELTNLSRWSLVILLLLIVAAFLIAVLLSGRTVAPFHRLANSIKAVKEGYASDFQDVYAYTEGQDISDACTEMLGRLKVLDDSRQEFVSNVSHELKTPLTSMKVLADSLNSMENAPVELYQEFMQDITSEIDRENKIINDLLSLVRLDKSAGELNISSVSINELLNLLMKRLKPIAEKQEIELVLESFRPVLAEIDEVKMTLALSNLIENAIKYNKPQGYVHVTLNADHQHFFVSVMDNGIGIPQESLDHIFERFYRVDKSHSREIGGTGLGLAITRNIIIMHRGAIKVQSTEGEGTTFQVRIPLVYLSGR